MYLKRLHALQVWICLCGINQMVRHKLQCFIACLNVAVVVVCWSTSTFFLFPSLFFCLSFLYNLSFLFFFTLLHSVPFHFSSLRPRVWGTSFRPGWRRRIESTERKRRKGREKEGLRGCWHRVFFPRNNDRTRETEKEGKQRELWKRGKEMKEEVNEEESVICKGIKVGRGEKWERKCALGRTSWKGGERGMKMCRSRAFWTAEEWEVKTRWGGSV